MITDYEATLAEVEQLAAGKHNRVLLTVPVQTPPVPRALQRGVNAAALMHVEAVRGTLGRTRSEIPEDRRDEVLNYLLKQREWVTASQIAGAVGYSVGYVRTILADLVRGQEAERTVISEYPIAHGFRATWRG